MDFMSFTSLYPALIFLCNTFIITIIINIINITIIIIINDFQTKQRQEIISQACQTGRLSEIPAMQSRQRPLGITSTTIFLFEKKSHL